VVIFPPEKDTAEGGKHEGEISEILEKPVSRADQVRDALPLFRVYSNRSEAGPIAHVGKAV
jgi:hypothetical protein